MDSSHRRALPTLALALALACGDDGDNDDDTAAGTTVAATSTSTAAETTEAAVTEPSGGGDSTTGFPMECEGLCDAGQICVFPGTCSADPPSCAPAEMIICDFETGACSLMDVCSGTLFEGALLCETCG